MQTQLTLSLRVGLEVAALTCPPLLADARYGLLMNQASVSAELQLACQVLESRYPGRLAAIFTPQHGMWGEQQANMIESPHGVFPPLKVPVHSLYSEVRKPTAKMLEGLDCLVVDLQDVGTRVYTFAWTVSHCLEACSESGLPVLILDRPNPLGETVEGPLLDPSLASFVGRAAIPMRHGLTLAELALLVNSELRIGARIEVVRVEGWNRAFQFADLARHWIPPSPNMPGFQTALVYPGQVLLEGSNLSEGRGTAFPFEVAGAPFVAPFSLADELANFELPGVAFRPLRFKPTADKWKNQSCGGVALHVTDRSVFQPVRTGIAILAAVRRLWPRQLRWIPPPYEYEDEHAPIDIIAGAADVRMAVDDDACRNASDLDRLVEVDRDWWSRQTAPHRLYDS